MGGLDAPSLPGREERVQKKSGDINMQQLLGSAVYVEGTERNTCSPRKPAKADMYEYAGHRWVHTKVVAIPRQQNKHVRQTVVRTGSVDVGP